MSDAGDRLRERWRNLRLRVVVPEWRGIVPDDARGEPAVYADPFTLGDTMKLQEWIKNDSPEGFAMVIITKAQDEAGSRLFDITDRKALLEACEAAVVNRVGQELMASVSLEEARGN